MNKNKNYHAFITLAVALLGSLSVQAETWVGGGADNEFSTAANWDTGTIPTNDTASINTAVTVERSVDINVQRTFVEGGATLNVTGGYQSDSRAGNTIRNFLGNNSAGTVNHSGGTYDVGHIFLVGSGSASGDGTYNLTGGDLVIGRGGNSYMGVAGGDSLEIGVGSATGLFNISSGSLATRIGVGIGTQGTFCVLGNGASSIGIGSNGSLDGDWNQSAGGILKVGISAGGVTKILIDDEGDNGGAYATFENGSLLDVDYYSAGSGGGTWTVLEVEGTNITDNGLAFVAGVDTSVWSFAIDNSGANGLLTVTAEGESSVREPGDVTWDGSESTDWWNPLNWDSDDGLITGDTAFFDFGPIDFSTGTSSNLNALKLKAGTLTVSGGFLKASNHSNRESWVGDTSGNPATVNQTGGSTDINALEVGRSSGSSGFYNLSSGDFKIGRGVSDFSLFLGANRGAGNAGDGTFSISGGSFITRTGVKLGDDTSSGTGTFEVFGSECSQIGVGSSGSIDGYWEQYAGSTLRVGIDLGGVTKVYVDDYENDGGSYATFESGALLDVDHYNGGYGGGTWTVMEVENGDITNNGLAFAVGVDTGIWSFNIDNSGANGILTVTAAGDPAPPTIDLTLNVGDTRNQMMRYGLDYERLWYWNDDAVAMSDEIADWSVNDCNIDYIRCAMNSRYELEEGTYVEDAYFGDSSNKPKERIIPMMTAMQNANPNIKWFASPQPLDESYSNKQWEGEKVTWQPYPIWITGASTPTNSNFNFNDIKCAEYITRYLLLMKSHGFKITYLDVTNEWQSNQYGGRVTQFDVRDISEYLNVTYMASPWEHPDIPGLVLTPDDIPMLVGPSSWNYSQGSSWINNLDTPEKKDAINIASSHNTDRTGTAQSFADAVAASCNPGTEVWETEQHGWKSTSGANEVTSFSYYMESIRAGFTGINGWLAIGTTSQGHCYLLASGGTVTPNVKYYIFKKLSTTSNYGYSYDIDEPAELNNTVALIRDNLLTVWVNNTSTTEQSVEVDIGNHLMAGSEVQYTCWNEALPVEGVTGSFTAFGGTQIVAQVEGESVYCFEIPLVDEEANFPFVQAEKYSTESDVTILPCSDEGGGEMVAFAATDEIAFDLDIVKTYNHDIAFRVSSASDTIAFDIYNGTNLLATVNRIATGDAQKWTTIYQTLPMDGGPMDLRIIAISGGWNMNWIAFDQEFYQLDIELENLALGKTYRASNVYQNNSIYAAEKAFDGDRGTRWATDTDPAWVAVDFGIPTAINGVSFYDYSDRTKAYEIQYSDDDLTWYTAYTGGNPPDDVIINFPTVLARHYRYQSVAPTGGPSIWELGFYYDPTYGDPNVAAMWMDGESVTMSWSGDESRKYALQSSTNLVEGFTTIESGIPVHTSTNMNTLATPDDAAFYRVIMED